MSVVLCIISGEAFLASLMFVFFFYVLLVVWEFLRDIYGMMQMRVGLSQTGNISAGLRLVLFIALVRIFFYFL